MSRGFDKKVFFIFFSKSVDIVIRLCYNNNVERDKSPKRKEDESMINIRTIRKLTNGDGLTLKYGKIITYKSGWQVADYGIETTDAQVAIREVRRLGGNCGVWFENGIYYIDHSFRVTTKKEALAIGKEHNQISVFCWRNKSLAYC